jgi:hypothetical protein
VLGAMPSAVCRRDFISLSFCEPILQMRSLKTVLEPEDLCLGLSGLGSSSERT